MLHSKYFLNVLLISFLGILSCEGPDSQSPSICTTGPVCHWDEKISGQTAAETLQNWQNKWPDEAKVPDSFFVNKFALEELAIAHCGFRAYPGLKSPNDISSMGLVIVAIDITKSDLTENEKAIIFSDVSSTDNPNIDSIQYLPLSTAQEYTQNWREYNGVCLENDILGNPDCTVDTVHEGIPPRGLYGTDTMQLVPLGFAFTSHQVFCMLTDEGNYSDFVIYNCMYSLPETQEDISFESVGYRYDLYIRGIEFSESGASTLVDIAQSTENLSDAIDITTPCPFECGDSEVLQRSTN